MSVKCPADPAPPFSLQKYVCFRKGAALRPPEELAAAGYTYSYVNLLSKLSFFFVYPLLYRGAKQPLEMDVLGAAPPVSTTRSRSHQGQRDLVSSSSAR